MNSEQQCIHVDVPDCDVNTVDIQAITDSIKRIFAQWNEILQSESFRQTIANLRDIINSILTTKWVDLSQTTGEAIQQINYINFAREIKWPIYSNPT